MRSSTVIIVILVCAAVLLAGAAGYFFMQSRQMQEDPQTLVQAEREAWQEHTAELEKKIERLATRLRDDAEESPPVYVMHEAFGPEYSEPEIAEEPDGVAVEERIKRFFSYIDSKGYADRRDLEISAHDLCLNVLQRLESERPLVSGEARDLLTLMKNISFFFRILGKDTLLILKDIIDGEADIIEPGMALMYEWLNPWQERSTGPQVRPEVLYDYAAFFLDTLAGQSYLFRRDSGIRMLTLYYSVLVLDRANRDGINIHGIDIIPPLEALIQDIRSTRRMADRHQYLETLREIRGRY